MDDLISEFISETVESLSELDMDLVKLEQDPHNADLLGKIFRLMHTIKGTCGFLGLSRLEKTAHAAENLLDLFRSGKMEITQTAMTVLFISIDRVRYLVSEVEGNGAEPAGNDQDVIDQIEKVIADDGGKASGGSEAAPAAEPPAAEAKAEQEAPSAPVEAAPAPPPEKKESPAAAAADPGNVSAEAQAAAKARSDNKTPEFLRVQMSVLEDLINMVSELVLTRNQLLQLIRMEEDSAAAPPLQRLNRIVSDLQEGVMKTRMQPIGNAWSKLPRIVRDLTMELGKDINLEMFGEETELDRQVLEMIKDPLTHMVRNSCDHGIESRDVRRAAGKPETGTIKLEAMHEGGFIMIRISDDGKGLDARKIGAKALEKGLLDKERIDSMSDKQLLQCIFKAGFSTAEVVTNVSGRGVGMDVVRTNIEKIGGTIDMESTLGKGTVFTIQIPLTLAIISALIVEIDKARYAIPQLNIQELVRIDSSAHDRIEQINGRPVFRLRDRILPLIDSESLFGAVPANDLSRPEAPEKKGAPSASPKDSENPDEENYDVAEMGNKLIAVISAGSSSFGLVVDAIYGMEEIVIKSLSSILQDTHVFSGNTILGDGQVVMILDPAGIARRFEVRSDNATAESSLSSLESQTRGREKEKATMLVFKAGSETPKAIPLPLISRLQQFDIKDVTESGEQLVVKYNGTLMPLHFAEPQGQKLETDEVTTLILSDDVSQASLGLIIENIIDIMEDFLDLTTATARPGVIGSVTLCGTTVDVIDVAHYLSQGKEGWFAVNDHHGIPFVGANDQNKDHQVSVLIVDDSPFFRNMLKPILASAGYDVTVSEDALAAIKLHDRGKMFDVILSDIEMPEMTGYQFVEKMRDGSAWKDLPFIAITSHTTPQDVEHGYEKGFTKYIGKFDRDELIRTMDTVLSNRLAAGSARA